MRNLIITVLVLLILSAIVLSQEPNRKVFGNIELVGNTLIDSSFGGTGFKAADFSTTLQLGLNFQITRDIWAGPTFSKSWSIQSDSLNYRAIGVQFIWQFAPRFSAVFNPQYAVIDLSGFTSWVNFLFGVRYWIVPDLSYIKTHLMVIDGKPLVGAGLAFKIK